MSDFVLMVQSYSFGSPFWEKSNRIGEREKKRKKVSKNIVNSGQYLLPTTPPGILQTTSGPKIELVILRCPFQPFCEVLGPLFITQQKGLASSDIQLQTAVIL